MSYVEQRPSTPVRMHTGASEAARNVDASSADALFQARFATAGHRKLLSDLVSLAKEYGLPDTPFGRETLAQAVAFLAAMPSTVPLPELSVDPDGEIAFDWCEEDDMLSVSLSARGRAAYAWNIDEVAGHSTDAFDGMLGPQLLQALNHFA